jgi:hypothetical protein
MTRDDIIRMAKEAGYLAWHIDPRAERFAALVAAAEREACAKVCDDEATIEGVAQRCAAAIRATGKP